MKELSGNTAITLANDTCVYCGIDLTQDTLSKEHVIGKHFVPKGKLQDSWNLIVNACNPCNRKKSDLEDDISAITMHPDAYGRHGHNDEEAKSEGERKAKGSFSRYTKRLVKESRETRTVIGSLGKGINLSIDFTAPPQVEPHRLFKLARLQIMGFFYWITFDPASRRGGFWPGSFSWNGDFSSPRSDWGNPIQIAFMEAVGQWEPCVIGCAASGFFRIAIKRNPDLPCWSWALEWNKNYRILGFFGDGEAAQEVASGLPILQFKPLDKDQALSFRKETEIEECDDKLFLFANPS